jgi:hypothetical protein
MTKYFISIFSIIVNPLYVHLLTNLLIFNLLWAKKSRKKYIAASTTGRRKNMKNYIKTRGALIRD